MSEDLGVEGEEVGRDVESPLQEDVGHQGAREVVEDPLAGRGVGEVSHELLGALRHAGRTFAVAVPRGRRRRHRRRAATQVLQGMSFTSSLLGPQARP